MELIRGLHNLRPAHRGCVLTIGNFDGVHQGHQELIARTVRHARRTGLPATVMTFDPMPREFLAPESAPPRILTLRDKLAALSNFGIERTLVVRFDERLSTMAPDRFVEGVLHQSLGVAAVVVGDDFHFGKSRYGDFERLSDFARALGFVAEACPCVIVDGERCSSTAVREALAIPDLARAARLLGWPYRICGRVRQGQKLGRKLGLPTANIALARPLALRFGVYAVKARSGERSWGGVANLGVRPTLGMTRCLLETHLFGEPGSLYGEPLEVRFEAFLRPEMRFGSVDELGRRMRADAEQARALLAEQSFTESAT